MDFSEGNLQNEWKTSQTEQGMFISEAERPGIKIRQFDVIQKKVAPLNADPDTLADVNDYNMRYSDIPRHDSTEVIFDDKERMIGQVASYIYFIKTRNEVLLQKAALDKNYLVNGKAPLKEKYRPEIVAGLTQLQSTLAEGINTNFERNEIWYSIVGGDGGDIIICSMESDGKYKMTLSGLKNDEQHMEPDTPVLSLRTGIWLRDAGLLAPGNITPAQAQRVFTAPNSFFGGEDVREDIPHEEFTVANRWKIKVLLPTDKKSVASN